ncbi:MAG: hypothetical protein IT373_13405 [Polyangiaceae bacterium]|nr:hypothetical protein [Polyangiaceae bacterium]
MVSVTSARTGSQVFFATCSAKLRATRSRLATSAGGTGATLAAAVALEPAGSCVGAVAPVDGVARGGAAALAGLVAPGVAVVRAAVSAAPEVGGLAPSGAPPRQA